MQRLVIALVLAVMSFALVPHAVASDAQRRHPRPHTQYRYHKPYYRPYLHYWSPRPGFTCRTWFRGYLWLDRYGHKHWVPAHYGYTVCR